MPKRGNRKPTMTRLLRKALAEAESLGAVERGTGISQRSLTRFTRGEQSLRLDTADKLAAYFRLRLERIPSVEIPVRCTAFNEAGHAVLDHVQGFTVRNVSIVPDKDSAGRAVQFLASDLSDGLEPSPPVIRKHIRSLLAGGIAQRHAGFDKDEGCASDRNTAMDLAFRITADLDGAETTKAEKLVAENWHLIKAVADALLRQESLTRREFVRVIRHAETALSSCWKTRKWSRGVGHVR